MRVVPPKSFGAAWIYLTGSKAHNVALRARAVERGWKLSEWGLFAGRDGRASGSRGATEEEVYAALDLAWVPPELREDEGELVAAANGELPELVRLDQLRGDLQMHTTWSDGRPRSRRWWRAAKRAATSTAPSPTTVRGCRWCKGSTRRRCARSTARSPRCRRATLRSACSTRSSST